MNATWKTVRVFISSTFRDMQAERDHLVRFVFPKLRQELLQRRIHLVDVDLRWGVTSEQDALSVCREVVDECRPRFLCMLGGRYGWVPPGKTRSITADEVYYGVLDRDLKSRGFAYFYFRDPATTSAMVEVAPGEFSEPAGSHGAVALEELKSAIIETGLQPFTYRAQWDDQSRRLIGLKEFGDRVYADFKQSIDQEFGSTTGEKPDEFTEENAAMEAFIEERVQRFVLGSRESVLNELLAHANSTGGNGYICLTGVPGSGKSALLAHLYRRLTDSLQPSSFSPQPSLVISHFVGASPGSTDLRRTLRRLCHELVTGTELTVEIPEDPEKLRVAFAEILQQASAKKRLVILLDAINQFDPATQLAGGSWLPEELPDTVRIILSAISEDRDQKSDASSTLESLRHRRIPLKEIELEPLTAEDAEAIIREFLNRYRKSMTHDQRAALLAKADAGTPLFLLVTLEELRTLGTYEEITGRIAQLPPDTRALFIWILKRLEDDDGFRDASGRKIGPELVSRFVSLLGASRHGLSQQELVELLAPGDPQGNVAALAQLLRPYLMQRGELLDFYHGQFREAVAAAYLPSESQRIAAHDQLATYFRDRADPERNQRWQGDSPRPFLELVIHLVGAQRTDQYCRTLCDLRFIEARCRLEQVYELIADYRLAQERLPEAQADLRITHTCDDRVRQWTTDVTEYSRKWSDRRNRLARGITVTDAEPKLPDPPPACRVWSDDEIKEEGERIERMPTRSDQLDVYAAFVKSQCYPLLRHGRHNGFVMQHACNAYAARLLHETAMKILQHSPHVSVTCRQRIGRTYKRRPALIQTLYGKSICCGVGVTPDGSRAVSNNQVMNVLVWDLATGKSLRILEGHGGMVRSVCISPDGRLAVSASEDETIRVWDIEKGACLCTVAGHGGFNSVGITPDGAMAVSSSEDRILWVWDLIAGKTLRMLAGHRKGVNSVSMTPNGRCAVSGGNDGNVCVWNLETGQCVYKLQGHTTPVYSVSVTPDGRRAVSGSQDTNLRIWDIEHGVCLRTLRGHDKWVRGVCITPDGRRAVSGSGDMTIRVWDLETGRCLRTLESNGAVEGVSLTVDGRYAMSGNGSVVHVWDLVHGESPRFPRKHESSINCIHVLRDGRRAISGSEDAKIHVWNLTTGRLLRVLEGQGSGVVSLAVTPNGNLAVSGGRYDQTVRVWDIDTGQCLHTLRGHRHEIQCLSVTPDGGSAVSGGEDKTLRVWDLRTGQCRRAFECHGKVSSVDVMPDGRRAVSGSGDVFDTNGVLRMWDLKTGRCLFLLSGHTGAVSSVRITPNGRYAVSGSADHTLRVWDLERKACLHTLMGHDECVTSVDVTPDGRHAISGSWDHTLRVWDLTSGACLAVFAADDSIGAVAVGPDGATVVVGHGSGQMDILNLKKLPK